MTQLSLTLPSIGLPDTTEDPKLINALTAIQGVINGNIDSGNVTAATAQSAGVNQSGQVVKGASIIATSETRTNVAYGLMPTPDQVQNVVVPANGLIAVWYQATWQESLSGNASAAIFLGANQIKQADNNGAPNTSGTFATLGGTANTNTPLATNPLGLNSAGGNIAYPGDVTTGQVVGAGGSSARPGPCYIFAAAGTYTVAVMFKAVSGSVSVSNRRLYVQVVSYS